MTCVILSFDGACSARLNLITERPVEKEEPRLPVVNGHGEGPIIHAGWSLLDQGGVRWMIQAKSTLPRTEKPFLIL